MFNLFPTFRKAGKFFRNNVTRPGRALLFLLFFCSLGLIYLESPLLFLFTSICSIMVLAAVVSLAFRPNINAKTIVPDLVQAKKEVKADYYLTNQRNRSAFEVFVEIKPSKDEVAVDTEESTRLIQAIKPGKTVKESLRFQFLRRGIYQMPKVTIGSTFPFNLFRFRYTKPNEEKVIVTPSFEPIHDFQLPGSEHANDVENELQIQFANAAGASEYIGNREYQEGMPVRRWDYSSWARTGKPIVREYREQQRGTATIFIDNFFDEDVSEPVEDFEALLSLATAVVDALSKKTILVSRLIIGPTIYSVIEANLDEQLRTIGRKLAVAGIAPEQDSEILVDDLFAEQAIASDSYGFLLFHKMDPHREHFRKQFEMHGNACLTRVLSDDTSHGMPRITREEIYSGEVVLK